MGLSPVTISNLISFSATGAVEYASIFCANDAYSVAAGSSWTGPGRGICLITKITATVNTPSGDVQAVPFQSSGSPDSDFVIKLGPGPRFYVLDSDNAPSEKDEEPK